MRWRQSGQALLIVALGSAVLFGFLALALEGGQLFLQRRNLQRTADMAALSGAWAFYNKSYAGASNLNYPDTLASAGMAAANTKVTQVVQNNNAPAGTSTTVCFVDYLGNLLNTGSCNLAGALPGQANVRGVHVALQATLALQLGNAIGVPNATVGASSTAMMGPPTGATHDAPLVVQNYISATVNLPRNNVYGGGAGQCTTSPPVSGYAVTPDCRPMLQAVNLTPAYESGAPVPGLPPFSGTPLTNFYILHDDPTCSVGDPGGGGYSPCAASLGTVQSGEGSGVETGANEAGDSSGVDLILNLATYYVEIGRRPTAGVYDDDLVWTAMNNRITAASTGKWANQDCNQPTTLGGGVVPLTPDNPRLMRLPIRYATGTPPLVAGQTNAGSVSPTETVMFCVQYTSIGSSLPPKAANGAYTVTGYLVNEPSNDPTLLTKNSSYFGQDIAIRLVQ
jgi:Flp pilus assembly protein TadG